MHKDHAASDVPAGQGVFPQVRPEYFVDSQGRRLPRPRPHLPGADDEQMRLRRVETLLRESEARFEQLRSRYNDSISETNHRIESLQSRLKQVECERDEAKASFLRLQEEIDQLHPAAKAVVRYERDAKFLYGASAHLLSEPLLRSVEQAVLNASADFKVKVQEILAKAGEEAARGSFGPSFESRDDRVHEEMSAILKEDKPMSPGASNSVV